MDSGHAMRARVHSPPVMHRGNTLIAGNDDSIFEELLDAEVAMDMVKLREASRLGIPCVYREVVYRYLLGVAFMDKSSEMTMERIQEKDFEVLQTASVQLWGDKNGGKGSSEGSERAAASRRLLPVTAPAVAHMGRGVTLATQGARYSVRGPMDGRAAWEGALAHLRHSKPYSINTERRQNVEAVIGALRVMYSDVSRENVQVLVALALPFESLSANPREAFFCTYSVFQILTHYDNVLQDDRCMQTHCGAFLMMFRVVNAALYRHFFVEGITVLEWVPELLSTLLAGWLHLDDLFRLWDLYFSDAWGHLGFPLHPYVCLAILSQMTEELIECEKIEILYRLRHLPRIDPDTTLHQAVSIRESVYSKGLLT